MLGNSSHAIDGDYEVEFVFQTAVNLWPGFGREPGLLISDQLLSMAVVTRIVFQYGLP